MIFPKGVTCSSIVVPAMIDSHNPFPYNFIYRKTQEKEGKSIPIFLFSSKHERERESMVLDGDTGYLLLQGQILDSKEYFKEISELIELTNAEEVVLILSVPTLMKTCPEQHMERECIRQIGDFYKDIQKMENVTSVEEWVKAFGIQELDLSSFNCKISAVISFETMQL